MTVVMAPIIEIKGVTYRYAGASQPAIDGISLCVQPGESVGVIGPNGAGKSTLLLMLAGALLGSGELRIAGVPISRSSSKALRTKVGVVLQDPNDQLFMPTVDEDIAFGPLNLGLDENEVRRRVARAIDQVGLAGKGLERRLSLQLSQGEKRRVAIATVLAMQPDLLVLDEPTSQLDPRGKRELGRLLNEFDQSKLIASHDLKFIGQTCRRALLLDNGRIVADRPADELLLDEQLLLAHGLA